MWPDGKTPVYDNWELGYPDDYMDSINCVDVDIDSGKWKNIRCDQFRGHVCRVAKGTIYYSLLYILICVT